MADKNNPDQIKNDAVSNLSEKAKQVAPHLTVITKVLNETKNESGKSLRELANDIYGNIATGKEKSDFIKKLPEAEAALLSDPNLDNIGSNVRANYIRRLGDTVPPEEVKTAAV